MPCEALQAYFLLYVPIGLSLSQDMSLHSTDKILLYRTWLKLLAYQNRRALYLTVPQSF